MKKWTRSISAFPAGGRRRLEYLEIACARRLANVAQFGLARLTQAQIIKIYERIAFRQLTELAQLFRGKAA